MIRQGEIYWADLPLPDGSGPGFRRPVVVVQNDAFNAGRIQTTIVCPLTSNLALAESPGNVALTAKESRLPKASVVNVSQPITLDKEGLWELVAKLPSARTREIIEGMKLLLEPRSP